MKYYYNYIVLFILILHQTQNVFAMTKEKEFEQLEDKIKKLSITRSIKHDDEKRPKTHAVWTKTIDLDEKQCKRIKRESSSVKPENLADYCEQELLIAVHQLNIKTLEYIFKKYAKHITKLVLMKTFLHAHAQLPSNTEKYRENKRILYFLEGKIEHLLELKTIKKTLAIQSIDSKEAVAHYQEHLACFIMLATCFCKEQELRYALTVLAQNFGKNDKLTINTALKLVETEQQYLDHTVEEDFAKQNNLEFIAEILKNFLKNPASITYTESSPCICS